MHKRLKFQDENDKMDYFVNSHIEKEAIYEIYRSCRLCGAGAGYKMPIIQNVVDLDNNDVELKDKIRECFQIEVNQDDKMPPLICELCVDKVQDFYEFLEMCRRTNKRTRLRLGLPPQELVREMNDTSDCILGISEPVYTIKKETNANKKSKVAKGKDVKVKQETNIKVKTEKKVSKEMRELLKMSKNEPASLYRSKAANDNRIDKVSKTKLASAPARGLILKKREEGPSSSKNNLKRTREEARREIQQKNVKIEETTPLRSTRHSSSRTEEEEIPNRITKTITFLFRCKVCGKTCGNGGALARHERSHETIAGTPSTQSTRKASSRTDDEVLTHPEAKRSHLRCKVCGIACGNLLVLGRHMKVHEIPEKSTTCCTKVHKSAKVKVNDTRTMLSAKAKVQVKTDHESSDKVRKPSDCKVSAKSKVGAAIQLNLSAKTKGNCIYCNKYFSNKISLRAHQNSCKKRTSVTKLLGARKRLKPTQVRMVRCDPILVRDENGHYDISDVVCPYGLDERCTYPYLSSQCNSLLTDNKMVDISEDIRNSFELEDYVHWDSDNESDNDSYFCIEKKRKVESLTTLTLKTIFSEKYLGKVPKKKRKVKLEKTFDSVLNISEMDDDFRLDIDSILKNIGDEKNENEKDDTGIKILNVYSEKDMDYDSDRASFNSELDAVQNKESNQTSIRTCNNLCVRKSIVSKLLDLNDATISGGSNLEETSILENITYNDNELKNLSDDSRTRESNFKVTDVKNDKNTTEFDKIESCVSKNGLDYETKEETQVVDKAHSSEVGNNEEIVDLLKEESNIIKTAYHNAECYNNIDEDIKTSNENKQISPNKENYKNLSLDTSKNEKNEENKVKYSGREESGEENDSINHCEMDQTSDKEIVDKSDTVIHESGNNLSQSKDEDALKVSDRSICKKPSECKNINSEFATISKVSTECNNSSTQNGHYAKSKEKYTELKCFDSESIESTPENNTNDICKDMKSFEDNTENSYRNDIGSIIENKNNKENISEITDGVVITTNVKTYLFDESINETTNTDSNLKKNGDVKLDMDDLQDTDIDAGKLMDDMDIQLDEKNGEDKITFKDLSQKEIMDLESISDGEFTLDD